MEIAIRVVVVLFVAVVVAGSVIYMAQNVLDRSDNQLRFNDENGQDSSILTVKSLSDDQLVGLLETCAEQAKGVDDVECFAVKSDDNITISSLPSSVSGATVNNSFVGPSKQLFITYNLRKDQVVVE